MTEFLVAIDSGEKKKLLFAYGRNAMLQVQRRQRKHGIFFIYFLIVLNMNA